LPGYALIYARKDHSMNDNNKTEQKKISDKLIIFLVTSILAIVFAVVLILNHGIHIEAFGMKFYWDTPAVSNTTVKSKVDTIILKPNDPGKPKNSNTPSSPAKPRTYYLDESNLSPDNIGLLKSRLHGKYSASQPDLTIKIDFDRTALQETDGVCNLKFRPQVLIYSNNNVCWRSSGTIEEIHDLPHNSAFFNINKDINKIIAQEIGSVVGSINIK
jgi:hypothetical protein